jgi:hypothetical protein
MLPQTITSMISMPVQKNNEKVSQVTSERWLRVLSVEVLIAAQTPVLCFVSVAQYVDKYEYLHATASQQRTQPDLLS